MIGGICGHVGDGNFHSKDLTISHGRKLTREAILLYNDTEKQVATDLVHRMIQRAIAMDGTITGEHGVGLKKREYLREELGEETVDAMRKVRTSHSTPGKPLSLTL